ncbi:MAG: hypothetical protein CM1200mP18_04420 [Gammaproteobacteria bacterium]|nr:MAG: hypothetical protein CM1200mP18_04420 [Gammaproteobacteria bacterium]
MTEHGDGVWGRLSQVVIKTTLEPESLRGPENAIKTRML